METQRQSALTCKAKLRYRVRSFVSLEKCLNELERFVLNGEHLLTGKPFRQFGHMRSREVLANWLLCAVLNFESGADRCYLSTDPEGGDGLIVDHEDGTGQPTEHVMVPRPRGRQASVCQGTEGSILRQIGIKNAKGEAYGSGKVLVVFLDRGGEAWWPTRVARRLPSPLHFVEVWIVGLQRVVADGYIYAVTLLDIAEGHAPTWSVRINGDFRAWNVSRVQ